MLFHGGIRYTGQRMSFFTPPPLRPKCARPARPGFKRFDRRGVYIVLFASMIFVGLMCAGIAFLIARFLLWSWLLQMGSATLWVTLITVAGFFLGARIGNWSGKLILVEVALHADQQQPI
ncbi:hypothetical protein KBC54_02940 [Patescibacteria group bacterium]|nr:hypothetical protein [Patescibacteria group bacterium]